MKNRSLIVYLCLFLLLSVTTITAQQKDHLKFMGIPISGNVNDFVEKLKSKGFTPPPIDVSNEGLIMLGGKFTNRDIAVALVSNASNNNIYRVGVLFEQQSDWGNLESHYNYLIDAFTAKYGNYSRPHQFCYKPHQSVTNNKFIMVELVA